MPIYEIACSDCNYSGERIVLTAEEDLTCPDCGSRKTRKLMSATSSLTGKAPQSFPGSVDTACCGSSPSQASCAGPGSCCGKTI